MRIKRVSIWVGCFVAALTATNLAADDESLQTYLVQGRLVAELVGQVRQVGGEVTDVMPALDLVAARLTAGAAGRLRILEGVSSVFADGPVTTAGKNGDSDSDSDSSGAAVPATDYPSRIGADLLHAQGIKGYGLTVAFVDSGYHDFESQKKNSLGQDRLLAQYDAIQREEMGLTDGYGHGSHVSAVALNSASATGSGGYSGIAPDADFVMVKAFDSQGVGAYADVLHGLNWVLENRDTYGIRILNLSFSAPVRSPYWEDPIGRVVMKAWQEPA